MALGSGLFASAITRLTEDWQDEAVAFNKRSLAETDSEYTKGPGSRAAGVAMAFKLIESAQARWRAVNTPHLVALVRVGAKFERGVLVEQTGKGIEQSSASRLTLQA